MSSYQNKRIRSVATEPAAIEMVLLKQLMLLAIESDMAVSYRNRLYLFRDEGGFVISRAESPESSIALSLLQTGMAVDKFVEAFAEESDCSLQHVTFHPTTDVTTPGVRWWFLRRVITLDIFMRNTSNLQSEVYALVEAVQQDKAYESDS